MTDRLLELARTHTPSERTTLLFGLIRDSPRWHQNALAICEFIRHCHSAGVDLDEVDDEGYTLAQYCSARLLPVLTELVRLGANPSVGNWADTPRCSDACVHMHLVWSEAFLPPTEDSGEYYSFLVALVACGRLELPAACSCVIRRLTRKGEYGCCFASVQQAQQRYRRALVALPGLPVPDAVWTCVVLPYLHWSYLILNPRD